MPAAAPGAKENARLIVAGHGDGTVAAWDVIDPRGGSARCDAGPRFHLPAHAAPILLVRDLAGPTPGVAVVSSDGEVRVWSGARLAPPPGDDDDPGDDPDIGDFALLGRLDAGVVAHAEPPDLGEDAPLKPQRFTAAALVPPRKRRRRVDARTLRELQELVLGTFDGDVEVWALPRDDLDERAGGRGGDAAVLPTAEDVLRPKPLV